MCSSLFACDIKVLVGVYEAQEGKPLACKDSKIRINMKI